VTSRVLVALRIAAPPARVFEAFTAEIGEWWRPNGLFAASRQPPGRLAMEPGVGGRVTETHPDGEVVEIECLFVSRGTSMVIGHRLVARPGSGLAEEPVAGV
jgi:uncharacterized protein YndB with AHSA1/START domain